MTDFTALIPTAKAFYAGLTADNSRDWWQAHKATYDDALKTPALALLDELAGPLSELTGAPVQTKLFRPHRDVRFSRDKTPYNTHLHMIWQMDTEAPQNPVFFFGIGVDYVTVGGGIMEFDKAVLTNWRQMVDLDGDRIGGIVDAVHTAGFNLREPALKRVPSPWPQDHERADLLRMKGVVARRELGPEDPLAAQIMAAYRGLWPLNALLLQIAEA